MHPYVKTLSRRSASTFWELAKVMLPVMVVVRIGEEFGLSHVLGDVLAPIMGFAGLPAETGIIWAICLLTGIYGGMGAYIALLPDLSLTVGQNSVLCAMMLIAHALPVEQVIVRRAGVSFLATALLRLVGALVYGAVVSWLISITGALSEPMDLSWLTPATVQNDWQSWGLETVKSMLMIFAIIVLLFIALDILGKAGITKRLVAAAEPLLRLNGIDPRLAPLTMIGVLLGLSYGGALIIQAVRENTYSPRAKFLALSWLSLSHSLIEDTLLMVAIGGDLWVILVGRVVFTFVVIGAIAAALKRLPEPATA